VRPRLPPPDELEPDLIAEGQELVVFRITRTDDHDSVDFADSFRSRAELGLPPRPGTPEQTHPQIHDGISVYDTREAATATARAVRRAGRDIGGYVTQLRLDPTTGASYFRWGARGHLTLWADPLMLIETATDTISIEAEGAPDGVHDPR
jgi:hypothetical protein